MDTQEQIQEILTNFEIVPKKIENFDVGGVNSSIAYKIIGKSGDFLLKSIREDRINWVKDGANLVNHLKEHGFTKTPQNLKDINGEYVVKHEDTFWTLQEFVKGRQLKNNEISTDECKSLGKTIAELHKAYLDDNSILKESSVKREISYREMFEKEQHEKMIETLDILKGMELPEKDIDLLTTYWKEYLKTRDKILVKLENTDENSFKKGIIHRDLNKGNILYENGSVSAIVDWEDVSFGNIIQDVAYTTSQNLFDLANLEKSKENIDAFLEGYESVIELSDEEKEFIPVLVDLLLVRATRWWGKRYLALMQEDATEEVIEKHRGGFKSVFNNWIDNKDIYSIFHKNLFS